MRWGSNRQRRRAWLWFVFHALLENLQRVDVNLDPVVTASVEWVRQLLEKLEEFEFLYTPGKVVGRI